MIRVINYLKSYKPSSLWYVKERMDIHNTWNKSFGVLWYVLRNVLYRSNWGTCSNTADLIASLAQQDQSKQLKYLSDIPYVTKNHLIKVEISSYNWEHCFIIDRSDKWNLYQSYAVKYELGEGSNSIMEDIDIYKFIGDIISCENYAKWFGDDIKLEHADINITLYPYTEKDVIYALSELEKDNKENILRSCINNINELTLIYSLSIFL